MRRAALVAAVALLSAAAPALAHLVTFEGSILIGHPLTNSGHVYRDSHPWSCDPASEMNGIDGVWFELSGFDWHRATLIPAPTLDADATFFSASCEPLWSDSMHIGFVGHMEHGFVPSGTAYILVSGYAGSGEFVVTLEDHPSYP